MVNVNKIIKTFNKKYPKLTVMEICDYDENSYVITAVNNPNEIDYDDPYYLINKSTTKIEKLSPRADRKKFLSAYAERSIYVK